MQSSIIVGLFGKVGAALAASANRPRNPDFPATHGHGRAWRSAGRFGGGHPADARLSLLLLASLLLLSACGGGGGAGGVSGPPDPPEPPPTSPPPSPPPPPTPAAIQIATPAEGAAFVRGEPVAFSLMGPPASPTARVEWRSTLDGTLGEGLQLLRQSLSPGQHAVILLLEGVPQDTVRFTVQGRDRWNLDLLGSAPQGGKQVWADNEVAFVVCNRAQSCGYGLHVIDLSNPAAPRRLTNYQLDINPWDVVASGTTAYVASINSTTTGFVNPAGVRILDIRDPANPQILADIGSITDVFNVYVADGFLYAANTLSNTTGAIHVFDVRDPRAPIEVAAIESPLGGRSWNMSVADGRLYGVYSDENQRGRANLVIADVSNPAVPVLLGTVDLTVPSGNAWPSQDGPFVFTDGTNGINVWDVSNPGDVRLIAQYRSFRGNVPDGGLFVRGRRGFVAYARGNTGTVEVLDLSNPRDPRMIAFYDHPDGFSGIYPIDGGRIVALTRSEVLVLSGQF